MRTTPRIIRSGSLAVALAVLAVSSTAGCAWKFDNDAQVGIGYESRTRIYLYQELDDHDMEAGSKLTFDEDVVKDDEQAASDNGGSGDAADPDGG